MDYLEFVEDYQDKKEYSQFDKVLTAAKRARDLYDDRKSNCEAAAHHKPIAIALYEFNHGIITPEIEDVEDIEPEGDFSDLGDE